MKDDEVVYPVTEPWPITQYFFEMFYGLPPDQYWKSVRDETILMSSGFLEKILQRNASSGSPLEFQQQVARIELNKRKQNQTQ